ncbi:MAG: transcriptional repressor [Gemmatimonadales bacterium]|nr:transcriptional repressor [Gemmatimonadales bacterium]
MPGPTTDSAAMLERFHRWLRDRRLPVTRQRTLVAEQVFAGHGHPSAETIRRELERQGEQVGTATIYRTLDLMLDAGCIAAHDFGDGRRRFEPMAAQTRHDHLVCRRCGTVTEFRNAPLERMIQLVADEHGFLHERHRVEVHGLCPACRARDVGSLARPGSR